MRHLAARVARLEAAASGARAFAMGWTLVRDGVLVGFAPMHGEHDPALVSWLRRPRGGFVFLITCEASEVDADRIIPAAEVHPDVRAAVAPYLAPGLALHLTG